jgi:tetratricopeptide (TPR) repeat protein
MDSYLALNQFEDARRIVGDAKARNPSAPGLRVHLYRLAFLEKDDEEMQRQVDLSQGIPGLEDELLWNEAATASYFGQLTKAQNLYRQAIASAERAGDKETAAGYESDAAFRAALFGEAREARQRIAAALRLAGGPDVQSRAALVLGLTGDAIRARALVQESATRFPEATTVRFIDVPIANAQVALRQGDAAKAVDSLQSALPYELGAALYPAYVRGMAFLALRRGSDAAAEFQKILDHRGIVLNSPIGALARLQLARALAIQGERPKARAAYQDFLTLWQNADTDIPILVQAKAESARLSR